MQRHRRRRARCLIGPMFGGLNSIKVFDSNWIVGKPVSRNSEIVISQRPQRSLPRQIDAVAHTGRYLIEQCLQPI